MSHICHGHDRVWFAVDSTIRVAIATTKATVQRGILGHGYYFQPVIRMSVANNIQKVSPYLTENTGRLHSKEKQVNYVYGNNRYCESHKEFISTFRREYREF